MEATKERTTQHRIPREEIVLPVVRANLPEPMSMYPGDALDLTRTDEGLIFVHRRHRVVYGTLLGYQVEGEWSAKVGDWDLSSARLIPVDSQPAPETDELERCAKHGRVGCLWCVADAERESAQAVRLGLDDRRMIEEAQS